MNDGNGRVGCVEPINPVHEFEHREDRGPAPVVDHRRNLTRLIKVRRRQGWIVVERDLIGAVVLIAPPESDRQDRARRSADHRNVVSAYRVVVGSRIDPTDCRLGVAARRVEGLCLLDLRFGQLGGQFGITGRQGAVIARDAVVDRVNDPTTRGEPWRPLADPPRAFAPSVEAATVDHHDRRHHGVVETHGLVHVQQQVHRLG